MKSASSAFAGAAFHCYDGNVAQQDAFHSAYPGKEIYFTECTGQYGTDYWSDIKVRPSVLSNSPLRPCKFERSLRVPNASSQWYTDNM